MIPASSLIGKTPLEIAIINDRTDAVLSLVESGAKVTNQEIKATLHTENTRILMYFIEIGIDYKNYKKIISRSATLLQIFMDTNIGIDYYDILEAIENDRAFNFVMMFQILSRENNAEGLIEKCFEESANTCLEAIFRNYPIQALENYLASLEDDISPGNIENSFCFRQGYKRELEKIAELLGSDKKSLMYTALEGGLFNVCHFLARLGVNVDEINRKTLPAGFSRQTINAIIENIHQFKLQEDDFYGETFKLALEREDKKLAKWAYFTKGGRLDDISVKMLRKSGYSDKKINSMLSIKDEIIKCGKEKRTNRNPFSPENYFCDFD